MKIRAFDKKGFSFVEVMFVAAISVMVIGAILSAWVFTYKTWTSESERTGLRVDLLKALETLKEDLRLSSLTYIAFYPDEGEPYSAISLPVAETDANGFLSLDGDGDIEWDRTIIYHLYDEADGTTTLRRTVIDPRDNSLTDVQRYNQLEGVVTSGQGSAGSVTDTDFLKNVEIFEISSLSPIVDFYTDSSTPERVGKVVFGWARITAGDHTVRFEITGKNDSSSGYDIGVDSLMIEPSGSIREMEYYASSYAPSGMLTESGGTAARVYDTVFSNENYLEFDASATGDYVEIQDYYDLWRESAFDNAALDNVEKTDEEVRVSLEIPDEAEDGTISWFAYAEAGDSVQDGRDGPLPGSSIPPVVIRTVVTQDNISDEGDLVRVKFVAESDEDLLITEAYITQRNGTSGADGLANQDPSGRTVEEYHRHQQVFFRDGTGVVTEGVTVPAGSEVWSVWTGFPLRKDKDYLISLYIADPDSDTSKYWQGSGTVTRSYALVGSQYSTMAGVPDWSSVTPDEYADIYITANLDTWKVTGTAESQIFDTTLSAPEYNEMGWSEVGPSGTDIVMKARSSGSRYMTGATDWSLIAGSSANPHSLSIGNGRYVQFLAELSTEPFWKSSTGSPDSYADYISDQVAGPVADFPQDGGGYLITGMYSTWVDDVEIDWPGGEKICTITGYIARKNDYGQAKVLVDGEELLKVLSVEVKVSKSIQGKSVSEENIVEIEPRNTGK